MILSTAVFKVWVEWTLELNIWVNMNKMFSKKITHADEDHVLFAKAP